MPVARVPQLLRAAEDEYYCPVTFDDPEFLEGLKAYWNNVDMLAGRTLFGGLLFSGGDQFT